MIRFAMKILFILIMYVCVACSPSEKLIHLKGGVDIYLETFDFGFLKYEGKILVDVVVQKCWELEDGVFVVEGYSFDEYKLSDFEDFPPSKTSYGFVIGDEKRFFLLNTKDKFLEPYTDNIDFYPESNLLKGYCRNESFERVWLAEKRYRKTIIFEGHEEWRINLSE